MQTLASAVLYVALMAIGLAVDSHTKLVTLDLISSIDTTESVSPPIVPIIQDQRPHQLSDKLRTDLANFECSFSIIRPGQPILPVELFKAALENAPYIDFQEHSLEDFVARLSAAFIDRNYPESSFAIRETVLTTYMRMASVFFHESPMSWSGLDMMPRLTPSPVLNTIESLRLIPTIDQVGVLMRFRQLIDQTRVGLNLNHWFAAVLDIAYSSSQRLRLYPEQFKDLVSKISSFVDTTRLLDLSQKPYFQTLIRSWSGTGMQGLGDEHSCSAATDLLFQILMKRVNFILSGKRAKTLLPNQDFDTVVNTFRSDLQHFPTFEQAQRLISIRLEMDQVCAIGTANNGIEKVMALIDIVISSIGDFYLFPEHGDALYAKLAHLIAVEIPNGDLWKQFLKPHPARSSLESVHVSSSISNILFNMVCRRVTDIIAQSRFKRPMDSCPELTPLAGPSKVESPSKRKRPTGLSPLPKPTDQFDTTSGKTSASSIGKGNRPVGDTG